MMHTHAHLVPMAQPHMRIMTVPCLSPRVKQGCRRFPGLRFLMVAGGYPPEPLSGLVPEHMVESDGEAWFRSMW